MQAYDHWQSGDYTALAFDVINAGVGMLTAGVGAQNFAKGKCFVTDTLVWVPRDLCTVADARVTLDEHEPDGCPQYGFTTVLVAVALSAGVFGWYADGRRRRERKAALDRYFQGPDEPMPERHQPLELSRRQVEMLGEEGFATLFDSPEPAGLDQFDPEFFARARDEVPVSERGEGTCAVLEAPPATVVDRPMPRVARQRSAVPASRHIQPRPKPKRRLPSYGVVWLAFCLAVAGLFGLASRWSSDSPDAPSRHLTTATAVQSDHATRRIQDIRVGDRVLGENPLREDVETDFQEPEPFGWRRLKLQMVKPDGHGLDVELLRPLSWTVETGAEPGGTIVLQVPELGIEGPAEVLAVEPCPPIRPGRGHVVTGTFAHEPSTDLINVLVEGDAEPIGCTPNHPFWSETQGEFVQAAQLEPGEEVRTASQGVVAVTSVTPRPASDRVYNLEVHGQHVYQVGTTGVLVHNGTSVYLGSISTKNWNRIFGKGKRGWKPSATEKHHTIPREIQKKLPSPVRKHPDVRGRKGNPNKKSIPYAKHREIHEGPGGGKYNERFDEMIEEAGGYDSMTPPKVNEIRDDLVTEFGI